MTTILNEQFNDICTTATPRCGVVGWGNVRQGSPEEGGAGKGRMKRKEGARMEGRSAAERQGRSEDLGFNCIEI